MTELSKPRILVAEDNVFLATIAQFNLERADFAVEVASDGRQAYEIANNNHLDLLVTDVHMPLMSGIELCRRLRCDDRYAKTPIVLMTGKPLELEAQKLKDELQVSVIIDKPYSPSRLVMTVESLLSDKPLCL